MRRGGQQRGGRRRQPLVLRQVLADHTAMGIVLVSSGFGGDLCLAAGVRCRVVRARRRARMLALTGHRHAAGAAVTAVDEVVQAMPRGSQQEMPAHQDQDDSGTLERVHRPGSKKARSDSGLIIAGLRISSSSLADIAGRHRRSKALSPASEPRDGVFIHISHGTDDPRRVLMALNMAAIMSDDRDVLAYFDIKAIEVVLRDGRDLAYSHFPSYKKQLAALPQKGLILMACPGCLKAAGKTTDGSGPRRSGRRQGQVQLVYQGQDLDFGLLTGTGKHRDRFRGPGLSIRSSLVAATRCSPAYHGMRTIRGKMAAPSVCDTRWKVSGSRRQRR